MKYERVLDNINHCVHIFRGRVENGAEVDAGLGWLIEELTEIKSGVDILDIDGGIDLDMTNVNHEFLRLAKLGVVIATNNDTGKEEVQRIDDPEALREAYELDFTPPLLKSDAEAVKVYNENKKQ